MRLTEQLINRATGSPLETKLYEFISIFLETDSFARYKKYHLVWSVIRTFSRSWATTTLRASPLFFFDHTLRGHSGWLDIWWMSFGLPKSCQPDAFITPGQFFPQDLPDCRSAFGMPPSSSVSAFRTRSSRLPKTLLDTVIFPGNYFSLKAVCVDQVLLLVGSLVTWALRTPNQCAPDRRMEQLPRYRRLPQWTASWSLSSSLVQDGIYALGKARRSLGGFPNAAFETGLLG